MTDNGDGTETVIVRDREPAGSERRLFLRVVVERYSGE
jgi:hypothetical protein